MRRRGFLAGLLAAGAAPAIVRASSLMPLYAPPRIGLPDLPIGFIRHVRPALGSRSRLRSSQS